MTVRVQEYNEDGTAFDESHTFETREQAVEKVSEILAENNYYDFKGTVKVFETSEREVLFDVVNTITFRD
jgi:hypothetical protein